jgi:iron complex transport system substrate-binding protein
VRIASLVPSATEMLFALGLGDSVVAVTHECDYPPEAAERAHLTYSVIPEGLGPAEIDAAVRERTEKGEAIYELDADELRDLEPDLIVAQQVCEVCAVSYEDVKTLAEEIPSQPAVISLDPATLGEVLGDVRTLAQAADAKDAGVELVQEAANRIDRVKLAVRDAPRPRVAALEWLDPIFLGGHWVPQIIDIAGGEDLLGMPGEKSRTSSWDEVRASEPDVVVCMPCGYDADRSADEAYAYREQLSSLGASRIVAVDASSYFSRPGPRLIEGIELLAHVLHPDRVEPPPPGRMIELEIPAAA